MLRARRAEPIKWDSEEANAAAAAAAPVKVEAGASPKGTTGQHESPKTGVAASRTQASNFGRPASAAPPPSQPPGQPLVAARSTSIDMLNPYSNKWQIKARVIAKTELRQMNSERFAGSIFSIDLSDDTGEVRPRRTD